MLEHVYDGRESRCVSHFCHKYHRYNHFFCWTIPTFSCLIYFSFCRVLADHFLFLFINSDADVSVYVNRERAYVVVVNCSKFAEVVWHFNIFFAAVAVLLLAWIQFGFPVVCPRIFLSKREFTQVNLREKTSRILHFFGIVADTFFFASIRWCFGESKKLFTRSLVHILRRSRTRNRLFIFIIGIFIIR